jgi:transposase
LDRLLAWRRAHPDNERFAAHLHRHREHLFTFLTAADIDATNHRAEQAIRPGVLARKVSGGSRTERGAAAHACLTSVVRTARQQHRDLRRFIADLLCGRRLRLAYLPASP